eukprot:15356523-Alexandrium_andersonii.AAC.1
MGMGTGAQPNSRSLQLHQKGLLSALAGAAIRRFGAVAPRTEARQPRPSACARHVRGHHSAGGMALAKQTKAA